MKPMRSPKDEIEHLRRTGDPRLSDAARKLLREITRGPDLAQELAAQGEQAEVARPPLPGPDHGIDLGL